MTTTGIILLCIAAVLVIALLAAFIVLKIRARRFRPTGGDKENSDGKI